MKMTFRTIVVGGLIVFFAVVTVVVFIPDLLWNPPQTTLAHPYDPAQERGRVLFLSNGCNYCHTQYVRAEDTGMGAVAQGGDYVYDNPMILGSERTGPDLSHIGRKRSEQWEIEHWKDPRSLSPLSIMPSFSFLSDDDLKSLAAYVFSLGDRVAQSRMILPSSAYEGKINPYPLPVATPLPDDQAQGWPTWKAAGLQEGKEIFTRNCLTCHGCAGNGLGTYGGTLVVTPVNFKQDPFRDMPDEQWFWHVSEGVPGTVMPTWKTSLTEDQRWKVIAYIQQTFAQPLMRDPTEGDVPDDYPGLDKPVPASVAVVEHGKTIYSRECVICHGFAGKGDGPYAAGLEPPPPDFTDNSPDGNYGTLDKPNKDDNDFFWRISEGLPWSAMPVWKLQYSQEDIWALVHYVRINLIQTDKRPVQNELLVRPPEVYTKQVMPKSASFERGKKTYLMDCAQCHGLTGQGDGWNGTRLTVKQTPLTDASLRSQTAGELFTKVTFGVPNTPMLVWGEFLPENERWDVIKYITDAFIQGRPTQPSLYGNGASAMHVLTLSPDNWAAHGNVISDTNGADLYATYCTTCHGDKGRGDGDGVAALPSGGPAVFPDKMDFNYVMWRIRDGVPESIMPAFRWLLKEPDFWDIATYVTELGGAK